MKVVSDFLLGVGGISVLVTGYLLWKKKGNKKNNITILIIGVFFSFLGNAIAPAEKQEAIKEAETSKIDETKKAKEEKDQKRKEHQVKAEQEKQDKKVEAEKKEKQRIIDSDITNLSEEATPEQQNTLSTLADMQFKEQYPYKGSKMHSIIGILQDWTSNDGETWFYKVEATIVNAFGAERSANVEVSITPNGPDSGYVSFIDY